MSKGSKNRTKDMNSYRTSYDEIHKPIAKSKDTSVRLADVQNGLFKHNLASQILGDRLQVIVNNPVVSITIYVTIDSDDGSKLIINVFSCEYHEPMVVDITCDFSIGKFVELIVDLHQNLCMVTLD